MTIFGNKIFTIRLQLRRIEVDDVPLLAQWSNDPLAYGLYLTPERHTIENLEGQIGSGMLWSERNKTFFVELREGIPLGTIQYWIRPEAPGTAIIALKVAQVEMRGKGYGTEAQKYLILFLFNRLSIRRVEMYTDVNNLPQQRCLQKLGFELAQALPYSDQQVQRLGYLYRLERERFASEPIYQHHYA
ncbi:MAG: GNAT family N-acetyltransferase [Desulfobulbus sp.]|nr:GNAT family N-acetyltransferase [Desulfobulbus sp.]